MTFNELKEEIISLGFDEVPGSDTSLAHHANRALERIYSDKGVRARARLYIRRTSPSLIYTDIEHQKDAEISYTVGDGSLFLCVCGEGKFRIEDDDGVRFFEFCKEETVFKERLGKGAVIVFYGKYDYVIATFAVYHERFGSSSSAIPEPYGERRVFLRERISDFESLDGTPTDGNGRPVFCLFSGDDELWLKEDFSGTLCISYKRLPKMINPSSPGAPIDIGNDLRPLLPLLCASYMLVECDTELSEFYEREYVERMKIIGKSKPPADNRYYDVVGW